MHFGNWRGVAPIIALAIALGLGLASAKSARAIDYPLSHTLPGEVPAYDFTTGGPYMAPPIPYGHYAKDPVGHIHDFLACPTCHLAGIFGGAAGLFHHGSGDGTGHGHGGACANGKCGHGLGFGHGGPEAGADTPGGGYFGPSANVSSHGLSGLAHHGQSGSFVTAAAPGVGTAVVGGAYAGFPVHATTQVAAPQASAQFVCAQPGCGVKSKHGHLAGPFHDGFGTGAHSGFGDPCGSCGGRGCGLCGGTGLLGHHGGGGPGHNTGCGLCGGKGCASCLGSLGAGLGGLSSAVHSKLASAAAMVHRPKMKWFVGPGGPVPLTPGYVPYIVTTRSPRDFFAFAPMNPNDR
jgi:hypothetical protein